MIHPKLKQFRMKNILYLAVILLLITTPSHAQPSMVVVNEIESEDALPSVGIRYYYYPNLDTYFDTRTNLYIYELKDVWIKSKELISGLRGYSLMNSVRVPITDYNGDLPYSKLEEHRKQFPKKYTSKRLPPKVNKEVEISER